MVGGEGKKMKDEKADESWHTYIDVIADAISGHSLPSIASNLPDLADSAICPTSTSVFNRSFYYALSVSGKTLKYVSVHNDMITKP